MATTSNAPDPAPPTLGANLLAPRRRGARRWLVIVSLVVHAGAIGAYVVMGMMRIERLSPDKGRVEVSMWHRTDAGGGEMKAGGRPPPPKKDETRIKHAPTTITQPTDESHVSDQTPTTATDATDGTGDDTGDDTGGGGGGGDPTKPPGGGGCTGADCATGTQKQVVVEKTVENVAPTVIQKLRLSGETQIHPADVTLTTMMRDGKTKVLGIVRLCLDTSGRVSSASILKPTGYPDYDSLLVRGVRSWTYRPHQVNGTPVPVCSTVSFAFAIK